MARLCSVKPDTVLKWIKRGRLAATRTAGGHHRVDQRHLTPFLPTIAGGKGNPTLPESPPAPLRCWEYLGSGTVREECKQCIVYQIRAGLCFQVVNLPCGAGQAKRVCASSCEECVYYRRVTGQATNVLVITGDPALIAELRAAKDERVSVRWARNAYETSTLVAEFRPAFVLVDEDVVAVAGDGLVESLLNDPRVPGLKVILGISRKARNRTHTISHPSVIATLEKPFGASRIADVIRDYPVETLCDEQNPTPAFPGSNLERSTPWLR